MNKLSSSVKLIVNNSYNREIEKLNDEIKKKRAEFVKEQINEFNNDKDVVLVQEIIEKIRKKFNKKFDISLSRWDINYEDNKEIMLLQNEINKLVKERDKLILTLELNDKKSKEYEEALKKLNKILGD